MRPATRASYTDVVHETKTDGGWSGVIRVIVGKGINHQELVFVDSDLLGPRRLVLTREQAAQVAAALTSAATSQRMTARREARHPDPADVDALRDLLELTEGFADNDQRARYLLSSNWLRDRGAAAAALVGGLSAIEGTLKTQAAPAGRQGPAGA